MRSLTERQAEILRFIVEDGKARGFPPTIREIGNRFGLSSSNAVADHLRALEKKGYVRRTFGLSRGLRVLEVPDGLVDPTKSIDAKRAAS